MHTICKEALQKRSQLYARKQESGRACGHVPRASTTSILPYRLSTCNISSLRKTGCCRTRTISVAHIVAASAIYYHTNEAVGVYAFRRGIEMHHDLDAEFVKRNIVVRDKTGRVEAQLRDLRPCRDSPETAHVAGVKKIVSLEISHALANVHPV